MSDISDTINVETFRHIVRRNDMQVLRGDFELTSFIGGSSFICIQFFSVVNISLRSCTIETPVLVEYLKLSNFEPSDYSAQGILGTLSYATDLPSRLWIKFRY